MEICNDCKNRSGAMDMWKLCCATRRSMDTRWPPKMRAAEAERLAKAFRHDIDDMRTMAGELRAVWAKEAGR